MAVEGCGHWRGAFGRVEVEFEGLEPVGVVDCVGVDGGAGFVGAEGGDVFDVVKIGWSTL